MDISHRSYRIVIEEYEFSGYREFISTIREVYYDHSGVPVLWSAQPSVPMGQDEEIVEICIDDLKSDLDRFYDAFNHEIYKIVKDGDEERLEEI